MKRFFIYSLLMISGFGGIEKSFSQDINDSSLKFPHQLTTYYHHGYLFPMHPSMTYFTTENINGFEIIASKYLPSINPTRPPEFGIGYYFSTLGNREVYGLAHALYLMVGGDFFRDRSLIYLQQGISTGISYNTERYDIAENYSNRAIGPHLNIFFIYSLNMKVKIGQNLLLSAGPSIVHTSSGNLKSPNYGLNLINTRVGLTYRIIPDDAKISADVFDPAIPEKNRYLILFSAGTRQLSRKIPEYFTVGSLVTEYSRLNNPNLALGIGLDYIYDPTEGREKYVTDTRIDNIVPWHIGIHFSYERIWNKLSAIVQPGYKIITPSKQYYYQYNRIGLRYQFNNNIVLNYSLKAHRFVADFVEFGVGYSFE